MSYDYREVTKGPLSTVDFSSAERGVYVVTVTPLDASYLLEKNVDNRKLNANTVARYQLMMERNEWDWVDGDMPLKFKPNGSLMNGQHRLNAQIRANVTGAYLIQTNVPEEAYKVMDTNAPRSLGDYFTGEANSKNVSALAKAVLWGRVGRIKASTSFTKGGKSVDRNKLGEGGRKLPTRIEEIDFCKENYDELLWYLNLGERIYSQIKKGGAVGYAFALYMLADSEEDVKSFVDEFVSNENGLSVTKQTILKKLIVKDFKPQRHWYVGTMLLAFDSWKRGKPLRRITRPSIDARLAQEIEAFSNRQARGDAA